MDIIENITLTYSDHPLETLLGMVIGQKIYTLALGGVYIEPGPLGDLIVSASDEGWEIEWLSDNHDCGMLCQLPEARPDERIVVCTKEGYVSYLEWNNVEITFNKPEKMNQEK